MEPNPTPTPAFRFAESYKFPELIEHEDAQLLAARPTDALPPLNIECTGGGASGEPWVRFTNRDRFGLALSGGGIRSATYNLGLLQSLWSFGVLEHVDYLSTVSGGGYIGGFWNAWKLRSPTAEKGFPGSGTHSDGRRDPAESSEVRHLREFSRFLMPRLSVDSMDLWNGIVAIVSGTIPTLTITVLLLALGWSSWLLVSLLFTSGLGTRLPGSWTGLLLASGAFAACCAIVQCGAEILWRRDKPAEAEELNRPDAFCLGGGLSLLAGMALLGLLCLPAQTPAKDPGAGESIATETRTVSRTVELAGRVETTSTTSTASLTPVSRTDAHRNPRLHVTRLWLAPTAATLATCVIGIFIRFALAKSSRTLNDRNLSHALDRAMARLLAPGLAWAGLVVLWWLGTDGLDLIGGATSAGPSAGVAATGGGAAASFILLRNWLSQAARSAASNGLLDRLKPQLPRLAANVAVAAAAVLAARLVCWSFPESGSLGQRLLLLPLGSAGALALMIWAINPSKVGLHEFYRSRIARCFLGASNPSAAEAGPDQNRQTQERREDDLTLAAWQQRIVTGTATDATPQDRARLTPIHLVCCAANNLAGDQLGTLYRGARSATVSARGVSLGGFTRTEPELSYSAALTASAAAFNSNMGFLSLEYGPAVALLASALNLRLGLWVPNPRVPNPRWRGFGGLHFLTEMFGRTIADESRDEHRRILGTGGWLHLSDGAHFENFGLYELLRRHCRYLIVSDCGADPASTFDDFARTVRRVREDFGIEIEIDLDPLKPGADGFARQHLVVGTIHYDGQAGADKGTLLFFKPVLTGDEPSDVLQYRAANPDFPQQSTADQFYDEPQWESYRRLGEHSARNAFRFLEDQPRSPGSNPVDTLFHKAVQNWQAGLEARDDAADPTVLSDRVARFESEFRQEAPAWLQAELFPEMEIAPKDLNASRKPEDEITALLLMMGLVEILEDTWRLARLDSLWSHPTNQGWMAWMHRWSATPTFRRWWPVLKSFGSYGFGKFVQTRLGVAYNPEDDRVGSPHPATPAQSGLRIRRFQPEIDTDGLIARRWLQQFGSPFDAQGRIAFVYELLPSVAPDQSEPRPIQVALARVNPVAPGEPGGEAGPMFRWNAPDLFIPPALEGGGFIGRFLRAVIAELGRLDPGATLHVTLTEPAGLQTRRVRTDAASRARRVQQIELYKSQGFTLVRPSAAGGPDQLTRRATPAK